MNWLLKRKWSQPCRRMGYYSIIPPFLGERKSSLRRSASPGIRPEPRSHTIEEAMTAGMEISGELGVWQYTDTALYSYLQWWCDVWCNLVGQGWQSEKHGRFRRQQSYTWALKDLCHGKLYAWVRGSACWSCCGAPHMLCGQPGCVHWLSIWEVNSAQWWCNCICPKGGSDTH